MPAELLNAKLSIPPLRQNLVARPRLIQQMSAGLQSKRKLTLISAPAGFGKTTLVLAWLKQIDLPAAWMSLEDADNDLPRFLAYLAATFQQIDEQISAPLLSALQSAQLPPIDKVLTAMLNEIAVRADPLILVLDDYHLLGEAAILEAMEFLLQHQPPQLHLVLTTREDPFLPLARFRARDQITEIRARDLRFTREEADAFLRDVMGLALSEQDVAVLEDRTEGWAVGLQLAGLSLQRQVDLKGFIADFSGSHRHILDYLTDEVLRQQPEGVRSFLLQTSILDRLSGPLCNAVTGQPESDRLLAFLDAANLFVIPLDEDRRWYRYHHLFSDLLRNQLARLHPEWITDLHQRASRWYEANGDIQAAVEHALQSTDLAWAANLIEQHAVPQLYQGEVAMVEGWFSRLPEAILETAPMLCISKAWAFAVMQRGTPVEDVERALQAADLALDRVSADQVLRDLVAGHAASIRAFLLQTSALMGDEPERLIVLSQEAQRLLPEDEKGIRSVNAMNTGYGYLALADLEAASLAFKQTLDDGLAGGNLYAAIYGPINMVLIALLLGQWNQALQLCNTNIERFNRILAGQNFPPIGGLYILKGSIHLEYNHLEEAEQALTEGLDLIRWTGEYEAHKKGYTALARLRAIQGNRPAMLEAVKALEEAWPEGAQYVQALQHCLSIRHWPDDPDVQQDAQIWLNQSGIEFDKLAVIESVDPISEANFESNLSAAHVVTHLARSWPGQFPLEDVHAYLERQEEFAAAHGFVGWVVEIAIARTLLYLAERKNEAALQTLAAGLEAARPTGCLRVFLDEGPAMQALLAELRHRFAEQPFSAYADQLLAAPGSGIASPETTDRQAKLLSERELEVLRFLADGLTYEEIGQQIYLSLNTVQFHVKNIYRKLLVNKRVQAIEKAREMHLI